MDAQDAREIRIISYIGLIVMIILLVNSLLGDITFRIKYGRAHLNQVAADELSPSKSEPIQKILTDENQEFIKFVTDKKNTFVLKRMAEYSITGLTVATNTNFFLRDVLRTDFDEVCLMDIGLVWGDIASTNFVKKYLNLKSKKTLGQSRTLFVSTKKNFRDSGIQWEYAKTHISHTHLIPANTNVMSALLKVKKYNNVKLDGYLVDIYTDMGDVISRTSLSRADNNPRSRGSGACEIMYVTKVQIERKIYE